MCVCVCVCVCASEWAGVFHDITQNKKLLLSRSALVSLIAILGSVHFCFFFLFEGSTLHLLTSSLSVRHIDFVIYNVTVVNGKSELSGMLEDVLGELDMRNFIVMSAQLKFIRKLFREVNKR